MDKRLIGIKELSEYLGITLGTAYVWVCQKKLPYYKIGKLVKFDLREIDKWVDKNKVNPID